MLKGYRGFTLAENLIAVILLGIVIVAIVVSFASARMYTATATHHYQAINLARDQIEKILSGQAASEGVVTIDTATGLAGDLAVSNPTTETLDVTVSWTEKMWADSDHSETIVFFLP